MGSGSGNISNVVTLGGLTSSSGSGTALQTAAGTLTLPEGAINLANNPFYRSLFAFGDSQNLFYRLYDPSSGTANQYQVASGKSFYVVRICMITTGTVAVTASVGWASAPFAEAAGSVTGEVGFAGTHNNPMIFCPAGGASGTAIASLDMSVAIPQNQYPWMLLKGSSVSTTTMMIIGKEQ